MRFYNTNREEICIDKFIALYGDSYFIGNMRVVKGVTQNSKFVEDEINKILVNGIKSTKDIMRILAWKAGKIKHSESQCKEEFVYAKDWDGCEDSLKIRRFGENIDYTDLAEYIVKDIINLESRSESDPWKVFSLINEKGHKGIGTVYLITLLYFISRGNFPIYDKYAHIAIDAITKINDVKPGEMVPYTALPGKNFLEEVKSKYETGYNKKITNVFGDEYTKSRDIDRALWVYGHLFRTKTEGQFSCS